MLSGLFFRCRTFFAKSEPAVLSVQTSQSFKLSSTPFSEFSLYRAVLDSVQSFGFSAPTPSQTTIIPALQSLSGHAAVVAPPGAGKTLGVLLPLVNRLLGEDPERLFPEGGGKCPRLVVLSPTRELAAQTQQVLVKLSLRPHDFCVVSPGGFLQRKFSLQNLRFLVLDEADELLVHDEVAEILGRAKKKFSRDAQLIFVSATRTAALKTETDKWACSEIFTATSPKTAVAAGISSRVDFTFLKTKPKIASLLEILALTGTKPVLVFVDSRKAARWLTRTLQERYGNSRLVLEFSGNVKDNDRAKNLKTLFKARTNVVLVSTALGSRGLVFPPEVAHVVMFDFPKTVTAFVHRAGRIAKAREAGRVTVLCQERDREIVDKIKRMVQMKSTDSVSTGQRLSKFERHARADGGSHRRAEDPKPTVRRAAKSSPPRVVSRSSRGVSR
jgi:superfamily II DNA/RNA helicase